MALDWTLGRKLALAFSLAASAVLLIAIFGYRSTHHLIESDRLVGRSQQIRTELSDMLLLLSEIEVSAREYAVSGDPAYLAPAQSGPSRVEADVEELAVLTDDSPEQQRRLAVLRPLLDDKFSQIKNWIGQRRVEGFDRAAWIAATTESAKLSDRVQHAVGEMDGSARERFDERRDEAEASARTAKSVISWGSVAGVVLIALLGAFITRSLNGQIGSAAQHIQSSSAELQAASTQQAAGAKEQATAVAEITTTVTELLATSRQITDGAQRVSQIAEQTASAARSGDTTVERGQESIAAIRRQVDIIVNHMLGLGKKSQQIGTIADVVGELAEQTNIVAINAAIEAAGAGEAGKRFGVVADEIRKLADRVGAATKEIRSLIEDVRGAVNTTIMTTETGSKAVETGSKQFLEVATAFRQIVAQVVVTTEAAREIGLSTKQQATAVEQVNVAIINVAQASRETEASTSQTLQTASQLASLSRDLLRMVQSQAQSRARARALA